MSKTVKSMLIRSYTERLKDIPDATLISIRGIGGIAGTRLRAKLREKQIRITVVQNSLARRAIDGTGLAPLGSFLSGASALCYGGASVVEVARELVKVLDEFPGLELKGAVLDGELFAGDAGVKALSKYPTREEGIAKVVTLIVSPGRKLAAQIKGPGASIAGLVKAIEQRLEKGEAVSRKVG